MDPTVWTVKQLQRENKELRASLEELVRELRKETQSADAVLPGAWGAIAWDDGYNGGRSYAADAIEAILRGE